MIAEGLLEEVRLNQNLTVFVMNANFITKQQVSDLVLTKTDLHPMKVSPNISQVLKAQWQLLPRSSERLVQTVNCP